MNKNDIFRFNWNIFPSTRLEAKSLVTPIGCLYTPFGESEIPKEIPKSKNIALTCSSCGNYINPYIKLDRINYMWWCPFCEKRSVLPPEYPIPPSDISANKWPVELQQESTTIDFILPHDISNSIKKGFPYAYFLVLDLYQHTDELSESPFKTLMESLVQAIEKIPLGSLIGLITFDEDVTVYSLSDETQVDFKKETLLGIDLEADLTKRSYIDYQTFFNKKLSESIIEKLQLNNSLRNSWKESSLVEKGYLVQITKESKTKISKIFRTIKPKFTNTYKPPRSSGLALLIGSIMFSKYSYKNFMGKFLFFNGGPCTNEPGCILKDNEHLRSHSDIYQMKASNYKDASKFYKALSYIANGLSIETALTIVNSISAKITNYNPNEDNPKWSIDIFAYSLDQVGIYEMKILSQNTSGNIYLLDSPSALKFKESLVESFNPIYSNARLKVDTSTNLKIHQIISNGYDLPSSYTGKFASIYDAKISDTFNEFDSTLLKKHFTNQKAYNSAGRDFTIAIYFEMVTSKSSFELKLNGTKEVYIQLSLKYWDINEQVWKLRVTTIKKPTTLLIYANSTTLLNNNNMKKRGMKIVNPHSLTLVKKAMIEGFDQETFIVCLTRLLIKRIDTSIGFDKFDDLVKLLDESLIKLLYYFCLDYIKYNDKQYSNPFNNDKPLLPKEFSLLPSLVYNLRKNPQLIKIINSSPDETSFNHFWFLKFNCEKSIHVVEPALYRMNNNTLEKIRLDSSCLRYPAGQFLIMDSVFNVVIFYLADETNKLQLHPTNNDKLIIENDISISQPLELIYKHCPYTKGPISRIHLTQTDHSQSRFLISRLNSTERTIDVNISKLSLAEEGKRGFWGSFKKKSSKMDKVYGSLKTDDITLDHYYKVILSTVYNYKIKDNI